MNARRVSRRDAVKSGAALVAAALGGVGGSEAQEARARPSHFAAGPPEGALPFEVVGGGRAAFPPAACLPATDGGLAQTAILPSRDASARIALSIRVQYGDLTGPLERLGEYDRSLLGTRVTRALDPVAVVVVVSLQGYPSVSTQPLVPYDVRVEVGLAGDDETLRHVGRTYVRETPYGGMYIGGNVALMLGPVPTPLPTPPLRGYVLAEVQRVR